MTRTAQHLGLIGATFLVALFLIIAGIRQLRRPDQSRETTGTPSAGAPSDLLDPVRELPDSFPRRTYLPKVRESDASGAVDLATFSAGRDLMYFDDPRVWWESDHDTGDTECDHTIHNALEIPLRRVIRMVHERGGTLEVHEAFRSTGIHNPRSLHKEGRAIDMTCDQFPLEDLAKIAWAAGFDWVYYEAPKNGGDHIHASVRRNSEPAQP